MSTTNELIEQVISQEGVKLTAEDRKRYTEALKKIVEDKEIPAEALGVNKSSLELVYGHAYRLFNSGQYQNALPLFAYLFTMDYFVPKYLFGLAACHHRLKQYEDAIFCYFEAFQLDNTNVIPLFHASDCAIKLEADSLAYVLLGLTIELSRDQQKFSLIKERAKMMQDALKIKIEKQLEQAPMKENNLKDVV